MPRRQFDFHGHINSVLIPNKLGCFLLIKLLGLGILINISVSCPLNCQCFAKIGLVQCHSSLLKEIPKEIPYWVRNLSLAGGNVTVLPSAAFQSNGTQLTNVTTLLLMNNSIEAIEALAFQGLPSLITIDLSFNLLSSIDKEAFDGATDLRVLKLNHALRGPLQRPLINFMWIKHLKKLERLELTGNALPSFPKRVLTLENLQELYIGNNAIKRIDEEAILDLSSLKKLRVGLSPNPLVCDCRMKNMFLWLRNNSSQTLDAQSLRCYSPSDLNGTEVTGLKLDDFKCINEDLETASYVFFGIVLALIGVIFLMVLYLNRRGMKRWLNNFREACRDQMEGYHYRYEQDSDPRRSHASTGI
ncbi:hypothetical protein GDO86_018896 [Hymenochirus boettgeri]|uniref:Uncharacterized protein n=1 Tax=Hymenochirus boettgeri TaxID=247094 RepID=A0A8T2ILH9_9PIPI|nr:hypothetical protein GDO86_018896 [Hymenochirus boettgeri]